MPLASAAGLIGVASLSGLPPTNGFASKWLIYQSSISGGIQFAPFVAVAVVAFFASLSTLAYSLKYYGTSFLGKPAVGTAEAKAIPGTMSLAQGLLALSCIVIGLIPSQAIQLIGTLFDGPVATTFRITRTGGLVTLPVLGAVQAFWSPVALVVLFLAAFAIAELIRRAGGARVRVVPTWYCGEEHGDDEVRFKAQGYYSPFNEVFARAYPRFVVPRLPSIRILRSILDLDSWLYGPMLRRGGSLVDKVSRSHVGIPQLYLVWQVAGMIIVLGLLFVLAR